MARRSAPTFLYYDQAREGWYLRFRYVDTLGRVRWPRERSPYPSDLKRSTLWAPVRRAEIIAEIEAELRTLTARQETGPTVAEVFAAYEASCREQGTRIDKEASRLHILRDVLGPSTPAAELTPVAIKAALEALRTTHGRKRKEEERRPLAARSVNAYLTDLKAALNYAVSLDLIAANPAARVRPLPEPRTQPEALSARQVTALFRALDDFEAEVMPRGGRPRLAPLRGIVLAHYWTGHRTGTILRLRWEQIDLERRVLHVPQTKTGRPAAIPLDGAFLAYLASIRSADAAGWVFPSPATGRPFVDVRAPWRRLITLANRHLERDPIPLTQRLYSLRHSRISHLLAAGTPAQVVAQIVDNSLRTIDRHYAHLAADALRAEVKRTSRHPALRELERASGGQKVGQNELGLKRKKLRNRAKRPDAEVVQCELTK